MGIEYQQIEKELEKFYSNMCTSKNLKSESPGENKSFESFVEGIEIPQLNADEQDSYFWRIKRGGELFLSKENI